MVVKGAEEDVDVIKHTNSCVYSFQKFYYNFFLLYFDVLNLNSGNSLN